MHGISNPQPYSSHLTVPHLSSCLPSCLFHEDPGFWLLLLFSCCRKVDFSIAGRLLSKIGIWKHHCRRKPGSCFSLLALVGPLGDALSDQEVHAGLAGVVVLLRVTGCAGSPQQDQQSLTGCGGRSQQPCPALPSLP